ncbi:uncharacterized protein LOC109807009 [Cajanus cajan]|uniref:uncharacterized protein LOC109807009 n=1 Tax=Cajanus cajan TaxID=3821 RepID=UPI0010FAD3AF|nr:uncharacterized protein LOC109807009 [Cajanus cajan]
MRVVFLVKPEETEAASESEYVGGECQVLQSLGSTCSQTHTTHTKSDRTYKGSYGAASCKYFCTNLTSLNLSYADVNALQLKSIIRHCHKLQILWDVVLLNTLREIWLWKLLMDLMNLYNESVQQ